MPAQRSTGDSRDGGAPREPRIALGPDVRRLLSAHDIDELMAGRLVPLSFECFVCGLPGDARTTPASITVWTGGRVAGARAQLFGWRTPTARTPGSGAERLIAGRAGAGHSGGAARGAEQHDRTARSTPEGRARMAKLTRRALLGGLGAAAGLIGLGYALREADMVDAGTAGPPGPGVGPGMMNRGAGGPGMMGSATTADMSTYMEMFNRHTELRRVVEEIPGGVRTTTESDSPDLIAQLQAHVSNMYTHVGQGSEVACMSQSLPILFRHSTDYRRHLSHTPKGVIAEETADDPTITRAIRAHAVEVSGFVRDGMPAMMNQMMHPGS